MAAGIPGELSSSRHPGWPARPGPLLLAAGAVALRPIRLRDAGDWSRIRLADRSRLEVWEPTVPGSWTERNSLLAWPGQCATLRSLARRGQAMPFAITVDGTFAGQITVGNIVRGALRSAWVGYWVADSRTGGGVATVAVALVVDHCFRAAGLHRIEATVRPENLASLRVLQKLGFREEGMFRRYLDIAGAWRDHRCLAVTEEDHPRGMVRALIELGTARLPE